MDQEVRQKLDAAHEMQINGHYPKAERLYREVLEQVDAPLVEAETRHGLGCTLVFTGMFDEGLQELLDAREKDPDNATILLDVAKTHLMLGMYEEAQPELAQIVERFPDTPEAAEAKNQLSYFD